MGPLKGRAQSSGYKETSYCWRELQGLPLVDSPFQLSPERKDEVRGRKTIHLWL